MRTTKSLRKSYNDLTHLIKDIRSYEGIAISNVLSQMFIDEILKIRDEIEEVSNDIRFLLSK